MRAAGIICEYNPFHKGHELHIRKTKEELGVPIVCIMSGNYVQRGDMAVMNKHSRAETAVHCGADLVIELPTIFACATSQRFARGAVMLLDRLGFVDHLSFGSECGDADKLWKAANLAKLAESEVKNYTGMTFAAARSAAAEKIDPDTAKILTEPNNILAIEYLRAIEYYNSSIKPFTIKREGAGHDTDLPENGIAGASFIRKLLSRGEYDKAMEYMPWQAKEILIRELGKGCAPVKIETVESAVMAQLRRMSIEDYAMLPDISEGLENRLYKAAKDSVDLDGACTAAKTKRYTYARLRRMYIHAFLGIKESDYNDYVPYIRVLAFNNTGRALISQISSDISVVTKTSSVNDDKIRAEIEKESLMTDLYSLAYPALMKRISGWEYMTSPVYVL